MEKFFIPRDKAKFVNWLLQKSNEAGWAIVFEYSDEDTYRFLKSLGTEVPLPVTCGHHYDADCSLTALCNVIITNETTDQIMRMTHALSAHSKEKMLFLIADDFHENCFSSSSDFYNDYLQTIRDMNLVDIS